MSTPKLSKVFEAVKLEKLHEPDDVVVQAKQLAKEVQTSVAALRKVIESHPDLESIGSSLDQMSSAADTIASFTQETENKMAAQEAAAQPAGGTFK